jgi:hypothetical protein
MRALAQCNGQVKTDTELSVMSPNAYGNLSPLSC